MTAGSMLMLSDSLVDPNTSVSWRLRVLARRGQSGRWREKLLEEGARGEAAMPLEPAHRAARAAARLRHALASRGARLWWTIGR